ncbi:MAG TPA: HAD family hydrolase [Candidatus Dormibacteraeota bacterium]
MIKAVFLDVGGVFHLPTEERMREALQGAGFELPPNILARAHYAGMAGHDRLDGEYVEIMGPYVEEMVRDLAVPAEQVAAAEAALLEALTTPGAWAGLLRESIEQLPALVATGARVAIVSNADGTVEARLREEGVCQVGPGGGVPVDAVIDSGAVGVRKPDPRIWEAALAATGVRPEEAIHVGDSLLTDVGGARAARIRPIHFDPFGFCALTDHEHADSMAAVVQLVRESRG